MASRKDRESFIADLTARLAGVPVAEVVELGRFLLRATVTLRRLNEADARGELTEAEAARGVSLSRRVIEGCERYGIRTSFNSDPARPAIELELAGEWWAVP